MIIVAIILAIIISYYIVKICGISKNCVLTNVVKNTTKKNAVTTLNELVLQYLLTNLAGKMNSS